MRFPLQRIRKFLHIFSHSWETQWKCSNNFESEKDCHGDHNHTSGKVRGLLCSNCNILLGLVKEDVKVLAKAVAYLNKHQATSLSR